MRTNFSASFRLAILSAAVLLSAAEAFANSALVRSFTGLPKIIANGKTLTLKKGEAIPDNAIVRTGPVDTLDIYFDEAGRVISLGPNSQMRIELATRSVVLDKGQIVGSVRRTQSDLPPILVKTARGVTSISRGDIVVNALEQEISVLSGSATYQSAAVNNGVTTQILSGRTLTETSSANTPSVSPTTPETTAQLMRHVDRVASATESLRPGDIKAAADGGKVPTRK
jgi:hypothetical protein